MLDDIYEGIIWKDRLDPIDVVDDKEIYVPYWFGKPNHPNEV